MPRTDRTSPGLVDTLVASAARTTSSQTGSLTGYGYATMLRAQLAVTAASGTSPTLNVVIEDTIDGGTNWNQIGSFTQVTATGVQVVNVTQPFSDTIRVRWTVAGTTPSFTFSVLAYVE